MTALTSRTHAAGRSRLVAYDHGAQLASWTVDGITRVWLSGHAVLDGSAAIRGGVPICFPWFGGGPDGGLRPSHGVVRTATWRQVEPSGAEVWAWELSSEDVSDAPGAEHLPGPLLLRHAVALDEADEVLTLALRITNTGEEDYPVEVALHTYLGVEDVRDVQVLGLEEATYLDKVTGRREVQHGPLELVGETDRVYDRTGPVVVADRAALLHHELRPSGATQTVVWNPWSDKAAAMTDLGDDEWLRFVCVEAAATGEQALPVPAGDTVEISCGLMQHPTPAT